MGSRCGRQGREAASDGAVAGHSGRTTSDTTSAQPAYSRRAAADPRARCQGGRRTRGAVRGRQFVAEKPQVNSVLASTFCALEARRPDPVCRSESVLGGTRS